MNGKKCKQLRRIARQEHLVDARLPIQQIYQDLKTMYKKGTIKLK